MREQATSQALDMEPAQMRELGYWVVDQVVEHLQTLPDKPAIRTGAADDLQKALGGPVPQEPGDPHAAMQTLVDVALENMQYGNHPRYFARVPGPSSFAGVLGDWLSTGFNAIASSWGGGSGTATVELVALDWLRQLIGLPASTEGILLSGGSMANLTALATARQAMGPGAVYFSDQAHFAVPRALQTLGYDQDHIRVIPSDERFRLTAATLENAIAHDQERRLNPTIVVASAGTTNTGTADELEYLADLCARENLWFHVDGAYGASAALCQPGRRALAGIERADSLVLDPHKWLFQPYDIGCLFVTRPGALEQTFATSPEYLADVYGHNPDTPNFGMRGPELTRRARGLKLWLTFRIHGARAIADAVARGIELAEFAQQTIRAHPHYEIVTPAQLGIVTFADPNASQDQHAAAADALAKDGFAAVTSTILKGRPALRLCTINPATIEADLTETLERLAGTLGSG